MGSTRVHIGLVGLGRIGHIHATNLAQHIPLAKLTCIVDANENLARIVSDEMSTKKPKGRELTDEQKAANQAKARRRVCIEHVNSSIKRLRTLKDVCRLLVSGIRDMIIEIGCALHNFRLRLDPWLPIPEAK